MPYYRLMKVGGEDCAKINMDCFQQIMYSYSNNKSFNNNNKII